MNSVLTVSVRSVVITVGVLVAVIMAYLIGSVGAGGDEVIPAALPAAVPAAGSSDVREIAMRGSGEATGVPDQLSFKLSVNTEAADISTALNQADARMRRVFRALREEGVGRKDVQTAGLDIRPVYDYSSDGPPVITGYAVSEDAGVLVRSLGDAGTTIAAAVGAGGDAVRLHGLSLKIGDVDSLMRRARDAAVAEATAKAQQYAEATGESLGHVISIKEVSAARPGPIPLYDRTALSSAAYGKVPIKAGSSEMRVTISVQWSLA